MNEWKSAIGKAKEKAFSILKEEKKKKKLAKRALTKKYGSVMTAKEKFQGTASTIKGPASSLRKTIGSVLMPKR